MNTKEIWDLALQYAGERQVNDAGELVFETPEAFADCFRDVLYSIQHPDTIRLDWLQSKMHKSSIRLADMRFTTVNAWAVTADGEDLRATIDAIKALEDK